MSRRRPPAVVAALVALAVLALAACSDDDDTGTAATTTAAPASTTTTAASGPSTGPSSSAPTSAATSATTPAGRSAPTLRQSPLTKASADLDYDVTGAAAQLDGLPAAIGGAVNAALATAAHGIVQGFEGDLRDFGTVPSTDDVRSFVEVAPTAELLTPIVASVRYDVLSYVAGAAHPASDIVTATFDLRSGGELVLPNLFDLSKPYLQAVADAASAQLTTQFSQLGADPPFAEGVAPTLENYAAWWVTADGLGIGFPAGQAGPYALGNQAVTIPWSGLRSLLAPAGGAAAVAG
jgi:hypothetical protein